MKRMLTMCRLHELVSYNQETGEFSRRIRASNIKQGLVNPRPSKQGYLRMRIDGGLYSLHRIAWFYVNGEWPANLLDHKDGDKTNNKISNLRAATHGENLQNISIESKAESGLKGAYFDKKSGKWQAKIMLDYKSISAGYYSTALLAHEAYLDAKKKHHKFQPEFCR